MLDKDLLDKALLDPGSVFMSPQEVLDHTALSTEEKLEILHRWEYDASEIAVAVEEGMSDNDDDLLRQIALALGQVSGGSDMERTSPSKQHGLPRSAVKPK